MLCFLVLMQNGDGLMDKSPDYITEKVHMLRSGSDAFAYLDINNMRIVLLYCDKWGIEISKEIAEEMKLQNESEAELRGKGFSF